MSARHTRTRLVTTGLLAVVVAAGVGANLLDENYTATGQQLVAMELGADVEVAPFRVHIHDAWAATTLLDRDEEPIQTTGVWVFVEMSYASIAEYEIPDHLLLRDSHGRVYEQSRRAPHALWPGHPDLWHRGVVAIEVPEDALGEVRVEFLPASMHALAPLRYGSIDLVIDPDEIETEPVMMERAELLPGGER